MNKTKIVCTIGPASSSTEKLIELAKSGMNVARINMSHGSYEEHKEVVQKIKDVRETLDKPIGLMIDLKGPEIRIGKFENSFVMLTKGQEFCLVAKDIVGNEKQVGVSSSLLSEHVKPKQLLLLSDGEIELIVKEVKNQNIYCTVKVGGKLSNNKSINVPGLQIPMEYLSDEDKLDILFGIEQNMDLLAISFVQSAKDVAEVRNFLRKNGGEDVWVVSKIESAQGAKNMKEIIEASDGVMVARGDLGVEIDFAKLPAIQKEMLKIANENNKFSITATQMLESMTNASRPTRAEVSDVANAVLDGSGAVMLSGETAVGVHPAKCVATMAKIADNIEKYQFGAMEPKQTKVGNIFEGIGKNAVMLADNVGAKAILVATKSGRTARVISCNRPKCKILAVTPNRKTYFQMAVLSGVLSFMSTDELESQKMLENAKVVCKANGEIKSGDIVVETIGSRGKQSDTTKVEKI